LGAAPVFASASEALDVARAALGYLVAADVTGLTSEEQAGCLRQLERVTSVTTAARSSVMGAFTTGKGYSADADYSPRAWLIHKIGITRGAAVSYTAWSKRVVAHPRVFEVLAAGDVSESLARTVCVWTGKLPPGPRHSQPHPGRGPGPAGRARLPAAEGQQRHLRAGFRPVSTAPVLRPARPITGSLAKALAPDN
jgi:hypothetical protein